MKLKKRLLSLLVCVCLLAAAMSVTALAAEAETPAEGAVLYLNGQKLAPTAEGATLTFENGGVATFSTVGENATGGTDYALTLENVQSIQSVHQDIGGEIRAAGLYFLREGEREKPEGKDTLAITLKGRNFIVARSEADDASATALVSVGSVSISGDGSLNLMSMPAEGAETSCSGMFVIGDVSIGSTVYCSAQTGRAVLLSGDVTFADGATLRWPTELKLPESGMKVLMNGDTAADQMIVVAPTDPVTRGVAVFNLWKLKGSPAPEGEYPFTDDLRAGEFMKDAIHWAGTTGISKGTGSGVFNGNAPLTHEQFAVLFYRMIGSPAVEGDLPADYPYADTLSPWAKDAVLYLTNSMGENAQFLDPQGVVTHGHMDAVLGTMAQQG